MTHKDLTESLNGMTAEELEQTFRPCLVEIYGRMTNGNSLINELYANFALTATQSAEIRDRKLDHLIAQDVMTIMMGQKQWDKLFQALTKSNNGHIVDIIRRQLKNSVQKTSTSSGSSLAADQGQKSDVTPVATPGSSHDVVDSVKILPHERWTFWEQGTQFKSQQVKNTVASILYPDLPSHVPSTDHFLSTKCFSEEVYKLEGTGQVLVINNKFDDPDCKYQVPEREGAEVDRITLGNLFVNVLKCGYMYCYNVKKTEVNRVLTKFKERCTATKCGFSVVVILTHGGPAYNTLMMDDMDLIDVDRDLVNQFDRSKFSYGADIPKIFLVQACRKYDSLTAEPPVHSDEAPGNSGYDIEHVLIGQSSAPLRAALRDRDTGSWFIWAVAHILTQHYKTMDLLTALKESGNLVTNRCIEHNSKWPFNTIPQQVPESRLIHFKKFMF